ncbi:MAG: hypothetical protein AAF492_15225, partial [Verrucomicrobiota bacterium]
SVTGVDLSAFWSPDPKRTDPSLPNNPTVLSDVSDWAIGQWFFNLPGGISFGSPGASDTVTFVDGVLASIDLSIPTTFTIDATGFFGVVLNYSGTLSVSGAALTYAIDDSEFLGPFGESTLVAALSGDVKAVVPDTTPPVFVECPADEEAACEAVPAPAELNAIDDRDGEVTPGFSEVRADGSCPDNYTLTRTWTAVDSAGNTGLCVQVVTVLDTTGPEIACPVDLTIECDQDSRSVATGVATATDHCTPNGDIAIAQSEVVLAGACPRGATLVRTWTATDRCGNHSSCDQVITVADTVAPSFTVIPESVEIDCSGAQDDDNGSGSSGGSSGSGGRSGSGSSHGGPDALPTEVPPVPSVSAVDNCDNEVDIAFEEIQMGDCPGVIVRTWTASDDCQNESEIIQLVVLRKACVQTARSWRSRPGEWLTPFGPVTEFALGCEGDSISAAHALAIMRGRAGRRSDPTIRLASELIAAILNVSQGAEDSCVDELIREARDFLCVVPVGSRPRGQLRRTANRLRVRLLLYNHGRGCAPACPISTASGSGAR